MDNDKLKKVINELNNLPTIVHYGFYQLRITHSLRDKVVELLKEQQNEIEQLNAELDNISTMGHECQNMT